MPQSVNSLPATESVSEQTTPFYQMHLQANARMVPFAGYLMPVQYQGVKAEHLHTRAAAGLFDVSHMGQITVEGERAAKELEYLMPIDLEPMPTGRQCYTQFTLQHGGVLDDLIVTRLALNRFLLVVNASRKHEDLSHLKNHLASSVITMRDDVALLALQGPAAIKVMCAVFADAANSLTNLRFMQASEVELFGELCVVSRSGYTGEDGFEISMPIEIATHLASALLEHKATAWVGLGARDSLRLEAGLCLYGHDLDEETSPIEAALSWSIGKNRRVDGDKAGGFIGADAIFAQLNTTTRRRVGFINELRAPVREGAVIVTDDDVEIGRVTSGGFSPTLQQPIMMAYVDDVTSAKTKKCFALVRGKRQPLKYVVMPFVPHAYKK